MLDLLVAGDLVRRAMKGAFGMGPPPVEDAFRFERERKKPAVRGDRPRVTAPLAWTTRPPAAHARVEPLPAQPCAEPATGR